MRVGWLFIFTLSFFNLGLALGSPLRARAATFNIKRAASVYVTPRGMNFFQSELGAILERNGVDLSTGQLPTWQYSSPTAISLDHLPARFKEYAPALQFLRHELKDWLIGFSLHDPKLAVEVRDAGYSIRGLAYSLSPDFERTSQLANCCGGGIALKLEITIPELRAEAREVIGRDLNNSFLGSFGIHQPWISILEPLKITIPVRLAVMPGGELQFETMEVLTNLTEVKVQSGYQSPLLLPKVQVELNDRTMTLDARRAENALVAKKAELITMFQHHLDDFVRSELPARLNAMAFDHLTDGFKLVKEIGPPGVDVFGTGDKFQWTLRLASIDLTPKMLKMELEGSLTDPAVSWDEKLAVARPLRAPRLPVDPSTYDLAFTVSLDVLNRIVALGYRRGGLEQIAESEDGEGAQKNLKLLAAPLFTPSTLGRARLHLKLERTTSGVTESIALKSPYVVDLDLEVRPRVNPNGTFDIAIEGADVAHATIADEYLRFNRLRSQVNEGLQDRLKTLNRGFQGKYRTIADLLESPHDLFGLPMRLKAADFDPHGYLDLYSEFGHVPRGPRSCFASDGKSCRGDSQ